MSRAALLQSSGSRGPVLQPLLHRFDKRVIASSNQHIFLTFPPTVNRNGKRRKPKLSSLSNKNYLKKFTRIVCSAVEDATAKKQELSSGSLNGADLVVEDRPDSSDDGAKSLVQIRDTDDEGNVIYNFLYPNKELLPDDKEMSIYDHLEELRQRIFSSVLALGAAMLGCFAFSKELIRFLEAPVSAQGVRFLQLAPGEFFFTSLKVSGYCGLLLGSPVILYEMIAFVLPGLTKEERRFLGPVVLGSSVLFYAGIIFSYYVLTPAALTFFVSYAEGVVESLWSIDQYFEFVLVLMFSTGLSFQVPVIQLLLGQLGVVSSEQMLSIWRYVVVGAVIAAAILTPSTDPLTQMLLAGPLMGLYLGGAWMVKLLGR
ncbi:Sec-independent protein translocase protein TATC [Abeliophyllum distichum]|uniref:Sec-independent protein translocase protein TATC n=1 Tax=Abeliophyllum distichum TaxID=126358 RepID=A0ABD1U1S9_9LAMI